MSDSCLGKAVLTILTIKWKSSCALGSYYTEQSWNKECGTISLVPEVGCEKRTKVELFRSCLKGLKGCFWRLTSAGGKKCGGTIRYLEIEEGDIVTSMISNKKLQKRSPKIQCGSTKNHKRVSQDIRAENSSSQPLWSKNWPAGPFLTSILLGLDEVGKPGENELVKEKKQEAKMPLSHHRPFCLQV